MVTPPEGEKQKQLKVPDTDHRTKRRIEQGTAFQVWE